MVGEWKTQPPRIFLGKYDFFESDIAQFAIRQKIAEVHRGPAALPVAHHGFGHAQHTGEFALRYFPFDGAGTTVALQTARAVCRGENGTSRIPPKCDCRLLSSLRITRARGHPVQTAGPNINRVNGVFHGQYSDRYRAVVTRSRRRLLRASRN